MAHRRSFARCRARRGVRVLVTCCAIALARHAAAQSTPSLADLRWRAAESRAGRFVVVPGQRAFVGGYRDPGLEVWAPPLQIVRHYWVSFRVGDDTTEIDGRTLIRSIEQTPIDARREYAGSGFTVRERIFTPVDLPAARISYAVESSRPIAITVHFTPSLDLMWPAGIGGQELHWNAEHSAYTIDEPSQRFRAAIVSRQIVAHEEWHNNARGSEFGRDFTFTVRAPTTGPSEASVTFAGSMTASDDPLAIAESLAARPSEHETRARERYASLRPLEIVTPDSTVNRAIRWAQVTLEQAWVCNPQLGCGFLAGYGPSHGVRRPQYAWFFGGDGLVTVNALLRESAYARARDELAFIMRYQNKKTGAIWHEMSQSAGLIDWRGAYPYMYVSVNISFEFLNTMRDYVRTTGDVAFASAHWDAIRAAYDFCRSTIPRGAVLPTIPRGKHGMNEQDAQRDELGMSLDWVSAAESFAALAQLTNHGALAGDARRAAALARAAIRPTYYDSTAHEWVSGHLYSGAPVKGLTAGLIALLHHGLLGESEQRRLLDELASPPYRAGWGIRSTPTTSPLYDPDSYGRGSVWALGTADAVMAFYEAGRSSTATAIWRDLVPWFDLDAIGHMHEALRGDVFAPERESVPDQTWSPAAFLSSAIKGMLGIEVEAMTRRVRFAPALPSEWDSVGVRRIDVGGSTVGLALHSTRDAIDLAIDNSGAAMTLTFRPSLESGVLVQSAELSDGSRARVATIGGGYEVTIPCPAKRATRVTLHIGRR